MNMSKQAIQVKRWRVYRLTYHAVLATLFIAIAFYFGPNVFLFGKLTWIAPSDFVPDVEKICTPIVSAMKAYRRDHGHLPDRWEDIAPDYIKTPRSLAIIDDGKFHWYAGYNHTIEYDFSPGAEGWFIDGPYTRGRIPAPPAPVGPTTSPATRPS